MARRDETPRDLLFGLLALQIGLIDQEQLIGAFSAWSRAKGRTLAEILIERGAIDEESRALLSGMAEKQLKLHGGDTEKSLAAVAAGPSTREKLSALGDIDLTASVALVGSHTPSPDATATMSVGTSTSDGQRFRVLRPHAQGGLGAVFVALDGELNREVALKQILDHHADDPTSRTRFLIEAEITGGLEHPGIVPVYGLGHHGDGRPYYAMRFIRGDSLKEAIAAFHGDKSLEHDPGKKSLALRKLLRRFVDVCNAIDYAHGRGVLHRDLKPGNVIVGKHGETLVVDWGLAKPMGHAEVGSQNDERALTPSSSSGSAETLPGSAIGTPAYMSPEQAAGDLDRLGPHSDVYSLGATLYCLLTGKAPFEGTDLGTVLRDVQKGAFPPPRQVDPSIDKALEAVCLKAMATRPEDRYATARTLADDIERWSADEPTSAWSEPYSVRARRWMRRNRTAVTAASVSLLALLFGTAAVLAVQTRANADLKKSNDALAVANGETRTALDQTRKAQAETAAALAQSEESRKQAEAVGTFLVDAFQKPDPSTEGRDVKVADILDQALAGLDRGFAGSKATQGALLDALGRSYHGLGLYPKAEEAHRKARAVGEAALGPSHRDSLASAFRQASTIWYCGRQAESVAMLEKALERQKAALGFDDPDTLETRDDLYWHYASSDRAAEAIPLLEAALAACELRLGPDHRVTLSTRDSLAEAFRMAGRYVEATALHESNLKFSESRLGPDHPRTLISRHNLALAYSAAGRYSDAIGLDEATWKLYESKLGADHPETLRSRSNLAVDYLSAGRTAEAIALHESTLKLRESKLGADHPDTLASRHGLASAYRAADRLAEAIPIFEATLRLRESRLGADHPDTLASRDRLASAYQIAGRNVEAIPIFEATLRLYESKFGADHPGTLAIRNNLALSYKYAGRTAEAVAMHEATWKLYQSKLGADHPHTLIISSTLAASYQADGRWAEAEAQFRETLARWRNLENPDSSLLSGGLSSLGRLLLERSRWSEAEPLLRESLAIRAKTIPDDWRRFSVESLLGGALLGQGRYAEAEPLIVSGYEEMKAREAKIPAPGKIYLTEAGERVARLYRAWGKPDRAAAWAARLGLPELPADVFAPD